MDAQKPLMLLMLTMWPSSAFRADRWRILVGADAQRIDDLVRQSPEHAYHVDFCESFATEGGWRLAR